jgi:hypothetical protein
MRWARFTRSWLQSMFATSCVGGCGHVPVTTMYKLWSFDMATADPGVLRAAMRVPSVLAPQPGGVKLSFTTWRDGEKDRHVHDFVLSEVREPAELARLTKYRKRGDVISAYRLAPADVVALRQLQAENLSTKMHGELGVSADACRTGALPGGQILSSTYLQLTAADGYLPVLEDIDLRKEIGDQDLKQKIPPCAAAR